MFEHVLAAFPPQTYPLYLVSDPDDLLADEAVVVELHARGCTLIRETDPVALRYRVEQARPWTVSAPLVVITSGPLNTLPYDLWREGRRITLALHTFFPRLSYPEVKALTPAQRARLSGAPEPLRALGRDATRRYLLRHVFAADPEQLREPAALLAWLDAYHRRPDSLSPSLQETLLEALAAEPIYAAWSLRELLTEREAFTAFVQDQWERYLQAPAGVGEARSSYLNFARDVGLQNVVAPLVRSGALTPVSDAHLDTLPSWAAPGILITESERLPQRLASALRAVTSLFTFLPATARWTDWQPCAWAWAELTATYYHPDLTPTAEQAQAYRDLQQRITAAFFAWLAQRYAPLAAQRLPTPHHLYHVPHYLAHHYAPLAGRRVALLVLDGMALPDWTVIREVWRARYPHWRWQEQLLLAQIPTLTAISRQALVSGLPPRDFAATLTTPRQEAQGWQTFWRGQGLEPRAAPYVRLRSREEDLPAELTSAHSRALCAVDVALDNFVHHATLGARDFYSSLRLWLQADGRYLEAAIAALLERDFVVALASDHGHVEAVGVGQPSEGILAETRGKRARLYQDRRLAETTHQQFPDTHLWASEGLLPDEVWAVLPQGTAAFTTSGETVVSHGGLSLDEVVVPFVVITV